MRRWAWVFLCVLCPVLAQASNPYLEEGRALVKQLKYPEAILTLELAKRVPSGTLEEKREVLELLGRAQVAEGQKSKAEVTFTELLQLLPDAEPDKNLSPKVREVFFTAKTKLYPQPFIELRRAQAPVGTVGLALIDPWRSAETVLFRQQQGRAGTWTEEERKAREPRLHFSLTGAGKKEVRWHAMAKAANGQTVVALGSESEPVLELGAPAVVTAQLTQAQKIRRVMGMVALGLAGSAAVAAGVMQVRSHSLDSKAQSTAWADDASRNHARSVDAAQWTVRLGIASVATGAAGGLLLWAWQ